MKITRLLLLTLVCSSLLAITGCFSTSSDTEQQKMPIPIVTGENNLINIDTNPEILPARPTNQWTPIPSIKFPVIYFSYDQSRIGTAQVQKLEAVATYMGKYQNLGLIVEGHCDEKGSSEYNIGLGERRALAVRDYLEKLGVPSTRLQTISYGSERPADLEHSENAWSKNRRANLIPAKM